MSREPIARRLRRIAPFTAVAIAGLSLSLAVAARADDDPGNLVANGNFSTVNSNFTVSRGFGPVTSGASGLVQPLAPNWTVPGGSDANGGQNSLQVLVLGSGPAGDSGNISNGISGTNSANIGVWGPGVQSILGPPQNMQKPAVFAPPAPSMCGMTSGNCNYVILDGDPAASVVGPTPRGPVRGIITQQINGLTNGAQYMLTFSWAGGQLWLGPNGMFNGSTTSGVGVALAPTVIGDRNNPAVQIVSNGTLAECGENTNMSLSVATDGCSLPNHGFSPWITEELNFTATASSEMLTFFGAGAPANIPPVAMITGIDLEQVSAPEPSTWLLLGISFALLGGLAWWRRRVRGQDQAGEA